MDPVFKRTMIASLLLMLSLHSWAYKDVNYQLLAPVGRIERPNMFGSDVMLLKKDNEGEGAIFVKMIENATPVENWKDFLLEKIKSSKTTVPSEISPVTTLTFNGSDFHYVTYKDENSKAYIFTGLFKKTDKKYVFFMMKDSSDNFSVEKDRLLNSLHRFRFTN